MNERVIYMLKARHSNYMFYMWHVEREEIIDKHNFYMKQATERVLSQFNNIDHDDEKEKIVDSWLADNHKNFDPENDDPADYYDWAFEHCSSIIDMAHRMRLSVLSGMYFEWDKQLRMWLQEELSKTFRTINNMKEKLWKSNFDDIFELLESFDLTDTSADYYLTLKKYYAVINSFKHGRGPSFNVVKEEYPEFFDEFKLNLAKDHDFELEDYIDFNDIRIKEDHITELSNAIIAFWEAVPEYVIKREFDVPDWFEKAYKKDIQEKEVA